LNRLFKPYGLQIVGQGLALVAVFGLVIQPAWQLGKTFAIPGRLHQIKPTNVMASITLCAMLLIAAFTIPLPDSVVVPLTIESPGMSLIVTRIAGRLDEVRAAPGQQVVAGEMLVRLDNPALRRRSSELQQQRADVVQHINQAADGLSEPLSAASARKRRLDLQAIDERLADVNAALQLLEVKAPRAGTVFGPDSADDSASPLNPVNLGAPLNENEIVCRIGDTTELQAVLWIPQDQIDLVRPAQPVKLSLAALPDVSFHGKLQELAEISATADRPASLPGDTPTPAYRAVVAIDNRQGFVRIGYVGRARIDVGSRPLGQRIWRYLARTFSIGL